MNNLTIGDTIRIVKADTSLIEHGCIGPVVDIINLMEGHTSYLIRIEVSPHKGKLCETLCSIREGEYEIIKKSSQVLVGLNSIIFET